MNKISQRLVFPSVVFAMTNLVVHAESIRTTPTPGSGEAMHQMFNASEFLQATDTTLSGLSATSTMVVHNNAGGREAGVLSENPGVSLIAPSNGKTFTFENIDHGSRSQVDAVNSATTDSVPAPDSATDGAPVDGAVQEVADVTSADTSDLPTTTTTSSQTSSADSLTVNSADLTPASTTPEPSSMILVSSMLIAIGCIRRKRTI